MKLLIIFLCITAIFADEHQNKVQRNFFRSKNQKIENSDSTEDDNEDFRYQNVTNSARRSDPNREGEWDRWVETNQALDWNAVFGGMHGTSVYFVMRAKHIHNGREVNIIGQFDPNRMEAFITHMGQRHRKSEFEILLHNRPAWANINDGRPRVPSTHGFICRVIVNNGASWVIGNLDPNHPNGETCTVWFNDQEIETRNFQYLAISCGQARTSDQNPHGTGNLEDKAVQRSGTSINGTWTLWNTAQRNIPVDAVYGGYDRTGPFFIIKASFNSANSLAHLDVPGFFNPSTGQAIVFDDIYYQVTFFHILRHDSHRFTPRNHTGIPITAAEDVNFCQNRYFGVQVYPGRLDSIGGHFFRCTLFHPRHVEANDFNILRRAC